MKKINNKNKNRETTPESLLSDLAHFGLCPFDWTIEAKKENEVIIKNIDDSEFQFLGKLKPNQTSWQSLRLISL
jgi:hypothetical protein